MSTPRRRPGTAPSVVALGGGHGLAASLSALRHVTTELTAVVTVADNGGSSGRLRQEFGALPPGDLRMALAALCRDDEWGQTWAHVLQHRFESDGPMHGHAVGNLLIVALWELLGDAPRESGDGLVSGLDWVGRLLGAEGRVLPMATTPLDISAVVRGTRADAPDELTTVRGQVEVATTPGSVVSVSLEPDTPDACPEAVAAIRAADWVVMGPGSWYSSVIPHLLVPGLRQAIEETDARVLVTLNLVAQQGETEGLTPGRPARAAGPPRARSGSRRGAGRRQHGRRNRCGRRGTRARRGVVRRGSGGGRRGPGGRDRPARPRETQRRLCGDHAGDIG